MSYTFMEKPKIFKSVGLGHWNRPTSGVYLLPSTLQDPLPKWKIYALVLINKHWSLSD